MPKKKAKSSFFFQYTPKTTYWMFGNLDDDEHAKRVLKIDYKKLLKIEKKRLGVPDAKLVFVGMANAAKYYWCGWFAFLKSKEDEEMFFASYLVDRLYVAAETNLYKLIDKKPIEILEELSHITFEERERIFREDHKKIETENISQDKTSLEAAKKQIRETDAAFERGNVSQRLLAEKYPTYRWSFFYEDMVMVGVPDGLTDRFAYEYKTTRGQRWLKDRIENAAIQANLYGFFFQRSLRRSQVYCEEEDKFYTQETTVDKKAVIELLQKWIGVRNGSFPEPPQAWKCIKCQYAPACILKEQQSKL